MSLNNILTHTVEVVTKAVGKTVVAQAAGYFNVLLADAGEGGKALKLPMPVNLATFFGVQMETDVITPIFINKPLVTESWGRSLGIQDLSKTEDGYFIYLKRNGAFLLKTDGFPVTFNGEVYLPNEANMISLEVTDKYNVLQVNNKTLYVVVESQEVSVVHQSGSTPPHVFQLEALQRNELAVHPEDVFQVKDVCVGTVHVAKGLETFVVSGVLPKQVGTHTMYLSALTLDPQAIDPPIVFRVDTSADELRYASALAFFSANSVIVALPADVSKFVGRVHGAEPLIRIYAKPLNKQFDLFLCADKVGSFLNVTDAFGSETSIPVLNNLNGTGSYWQTVKVDTGVPQVVRAGKYKSDYGLRLVGEFNYEEYVLNTADGVLDFSKVEGGLYKTYVYQNNVWVLNGYTFVYRPTTIQIEPFCTVTGKVSDAVPFNGGYLPNPNVALHKSTVLDVSYVIDQSYNKPSVWPPRESPIPYSKPLNTRAASATPTGDLESLVAEEAARNRQRKNERVKVDPANTAFVEKHGIPYDTEERQVHIDVAVMNARQVKMTVSSEDDRFTGFVVERVREDGKCYEFYEDFAFLPPSRYEVIAVFSDTSVNLGNVDLNYDIKFEAEFPSGSVSLVEPPKVPTTTLFWRTHDPLVTIEGEELVGYGPHGVTVPTTGNLRLEGKTAKLKMVFEPIFGEEYVIFNHVSDTTEVATSNKGKTLSLNGKTGKLALKDSGIHPVSVGARTYKPAEVSYFTAKEVDSTNVLYGKERGFYAGAVSEDTIGVAIERQTKGKLKVYDVMPVRAPSKEKLSFVEIKVIKDGVVCTPLNRPNTGDTVAVKVFAPFGNTVYLTSLTEGKEGGVGGGGRVTPYGRRVLPYSAKDGCYTDVLPYTGTLPDIMVEQDGYSLAVLDMIDPHFVQVTQDKQ